MSAALIFTGAAGASASVQSSGSAAIRSDTANPYDPSYGHPYRHGALPTIPQLSKMKNWSATNTSPQVTGPQTLSFGGGVDGIGVQSGAKNKVYLVLYGTQWGTQGTNSNGDATFSGDPYGAAEVAQRMFKDIGTGGELWSADLTQWCDGSGVASGVTACPTNLPASQYVNYQSGGVLAGVWLDDAAASPSAATQQQLAQEAVRAAAHFGNTTAASNRNSYYVVLSPTGTNPDNYQGQYCAWHDFTTSAYGDLAYSNQPYNIDSGAGCGVGFVNSPGTFDGWTITLGHEWQEQMSDQNPLGGWSNHVSGSAYNGQENSDECAWISPGSPGGAADVAMGPDTFAEQASWSNDTSSCAISHPIVSHGTTDTVTVNAIGGQTWTVGTAASVQASGSSSAGKTLTWSASGLPAGLSINSASGLISGTPTASGSGTATVTASDNTPASGSTNFSWTVNPAQADTVTVTNPGSQTSTVGTAASLQIHATDSAGKALTYSASGLPAGLSINSASGLISGTPTASGTSSVTVTASSGTASGNASFSWTVNPVPTGGIVNGGFETGNLTGWTTSGASATVVNSGAHSGTYAARLGATTPTNGDSAAAQTFTVPSGDNSLTFWYRNVCPDGIQYDWATATLRDNTTGTTSTVLGKTCVPDSGWSRTGAPVIAGHSYTLTLTNHDDNYPGDATYTFYDDVALAASAANPIVNGGFETGNLTGWTASGAAATVVNSGAHSGTYAAMLGSKTPTNGDSVIAQTFTATGGGTLTFWYRNVCPDGIQYDWATATLRDNTTGTTSRILPRTCVSDSGWTPVSAGLTAGHGYTLTLRSHDDNYPGDATYTLFDDVTVSAPSLATIPCCCCTCAAPTAGAAGHLVEQNAYYWTARMTGLRFRPPTARHECSVL